MMPTSSCPSSSRAPRTIWPPSAASPKSTSVVASWPTPWSTTGGRSSSRGTTPSWKKPWNGCSSRWRRTWLPDAELSVEALFDFDRLVEQLGAETPPGVEALDALPAGSGPVKPAAVDAGEPDADDTFARLEADLRERDERTAAGGGVKALTPEDAEALAELENWLQSLRSSPQ